MAPTYRDEIELPDGTTHTIESSSPESLDDKTNAFCDGDDSNSQASFND